MENAAHREAFHFVIAVFGRQYNVCHHGRCCPMICSSKNWDGPSKKYNDESDEVVARACRDEYWSREGPSAKTKPIDLPSSGAQISGNGQILVSSWGLVKHPLADDRKIGICKELRNIHNLLLSPLTLAICELVHPARTSTWLFS